MDEDDIKWIRPDRLKSEEPVGDLLNSPEMEPYMNLAMAEIKGDSMETELEALRELPLEKRYVWRIASALKWAFADFDTANVKADKETLSHQDFM